MSALNVGVQVMLWVKLFTLTASDKKLHFDRDAQGQWCS